MHSKLKEKIIANTDSRTRFLIKIFAFHEKFLYPLLHIHDTVPCRITRAIKISQIPSKKIWGSLLLAAMTQFHEYNTLSSWPVFTEVFFVIKFYQLDQQIHVL